MMATITMEEDEEENSKIQASLVAAVRSANSLASQDLRFHRSLNAAFTSALDRQNARLLGLGERLLAAAGPPNANADPVRLRDIDAEGSTWRAVVDVLDSLLERTDSALDDFTGAIKRLSPSADAAASYRNSRTPTWRDTSFRVQDLQKPQLQFRHVPTNDETSPFRPLLRSKPHASLPLDIPTDPQTASPHPYQLEIEQYRYPSSIYTHSEPTLYRPFDSTTATLVDTEQALEDMLQELRQAKEIAIDLEHHDSRSYIGIVCLMQISTRDNDWIIDTLKPWRRELQCLNVIFADPNIVKVLHGAYMDVIWLQRDLGLYLVGLFDTHYASRALGYTGGSLAFLLKKFVDFDAQKQYQMADWRIRPLPRELLDYARSDTHFLLYIYDCMRNELIQRSDFSKLNNEGDKLWDVLKNSSDCALQRYQHPVYDAELGQGAMGWYKLLSRTPAQLNKEQFAVFRATHQWRDDVARQQDDSIHYVMPNHNIFSIAKAVPLTKQSLLAVATPNTSTLRLRADELLTVIIKAKDAGQHGPEMTDVMSQFEPQPRTLAGALPDAKPAPTDANTRHPATRTTPSMPIRTSNSAFWGRAFESSIWNQKRTISSLANTPAFSIPLPALTAEIFADPAGAIPMKTEMSTSAAEHAPIRDETEEDVFVLKDLSRKRKRPDPLDSMAANSDEVALPNVEADRVREKAERKAARKAAKRAAKAAAAVDLDPGERDKPERDETDDLPFDYAAAPSILNPPLVGKEAMKERKKHQKQLNPYAKSLDTSKGQPRAQKEKAGKSMTFRH